MSKQGLGRDLGALMGSAPKEGAAPISDGVRSLMRGHNPPPPPVATPKPVIPRWYLLAGDVLLVFLALVIACFSHHPLSWPRAFFCSALVILAAVLAVIAVLMPDGNETVPPGKA
jgi:hypothetical protein